MNDDSFDQALRRQHAIAVARISPQVRAQLAQRRNAALRGETARRGNGMRYAAASFAAVCALAIGLQFGLAPNRTTPATPPGIASIATGAADTTMLDEDPEFYAWLASSDAQLVAME
jgi:anti-sigma-K factor RskA